MFPKVIWQDIINVCGHDKRMRVVQTAEHEAVVEWSDECDAMGMPAWRVYNEWYGALVGDLMRNAIKYTATQQSHVYSKIALIKLVRDVAQSHARKVMNQHDVPVLGLREAKELVEDWLIGRGITE